MSELPFLKNKNRKDGRAVGALEVDRESDSGISQSLLHSVANELMEAAHRKDIGALREALRALVFMIKDQDRMQDASDEG